MRATPLLAVAAITIALLLTQGGARSEEESDSALATDHLGALRHAVVIGIDDYKDRGFPSSKASEIDALGVLSVLLDPLRGGVLRSNARSLIGSEATAAKIRSALGDLATVPREATVLVYFAGHGARKGDSAYWVAQDSKKRDLSGTALAAEEIQKLLAAIPAERVLLIQECGDAEDLQRYRGAGYAFLSAARTEPSVFTRCLIEGLMGVADGDVSGVIDLQELAENLEERMRAERKKNRGLKRPLLSLEGIDEPSRFLLAIEAEMFREGLEEDEEAETRRRARLDALTALSESDSITPEQGDLGRHFLGTLEEGLGPLELEQRAMFLDLAEGRLDPKHATAAMAALRRADRRTLVVPDEFGTIKEAMAAAAAGDTVFLKAGRYNERIVLKSGIHLMGEGREKTVVRIVPGQVEILLAEDCAWGSIEHMQLDGSGGETIGEWRPDGIHLERSSLRIHDCLVHSLLGCGLYLNGAGSNPVVSECTIEQNGQDGVLFRDTDGGRISDCICRSNGKLGIQIRKCRGTVVVRDCLCELDKEAGIGVCGGSDASLEKNISRSNGGHGIIGWEKGTSVTLRGNTCSNNAIYGVYLVQRAGATATNNDCSQNKEGGIVASGMGTHAAITGNRCLENDLSEKGERAGIAFCEGAGGEAASNTCDDNAWGILVRGPGTTVRLLGNKCRRNATAGIGFSEAAPGNAARNECDKNQLGISVSRTDVTLQDNVVRRNTMHGIAIGTRATATATGNHCEKNEQAGIHVTDMGTRAELSKNECVSNGTHGIQFARGAAGTAEDNDCNENEAFGIVAFDNATRPTFRGNRCKGNGRAGIGKQDGAAPVIAGDNVQSGNGK